MGVDRQTGITRAQASNPPPDVQTTALPLSLQILYHSKKNTLLVAVETSTRAQQTAQAQRDGPGVVHSLHVLHGRRPASTTHGTTAVTMH